MIRDEAVAWCLREFIQSLLNVLESASCSHATYTLGWDDCFEDTEKMLFICRLNCWMCEESSLYWYDTILIVEWVSSSAACWLHLQGLWRWRLQAALDIGTFISRSMMSFLKSVESSSVPLWEPQIWCSGSLFNSTVLCLLQLQSVSVRSTQMICSILYHNCVF
jgi:hypothetical protein